MAFTLDVQLKLISLICTAYFMIVLFLKVFIFLNITLPKVCDEDTNTFHYIHIFAYFVSINVAGNYISILYMSRLSVVKPEHTQSLTDLNMFSSQDFTSSLTSSVSDDVSDERQLAMGDYYDLNKKLTTNVREYTSLLTSTDICENKNIVQTGSLGSNSKHSFGSYFTFQNSYEKNNIGQESSHYHFDRQLSLCSGDLADQTVDKNRRPKCKDCNTLVPPRAKHCPVCKHCVLKRDHHCYFTGCCIGYHNQRFFIIFCLYVGIGEIFNSVVTFLYLRRHSFGESPSWGCLDYVLPVLLFIWFTGGVSGSALIMTMLLYWSVLTVLFCAYFFCVQVTLMYYGQTKYEYLKGIKTYQGTIWTNVTSVLGRYWLIGLIIPAPFLGYQGDGANWRHLIIDNKLV